jgi:hypothetical protein
MNCKYCNKEYEKEISLKPHEIRCINNTNKIKTKHGCINCGLKENPECLDFDHINDKILNGRKLLDRTSGHGLVELIIGSISIRWIK